MSIEAHIKRDFRVECEALLLAAERHMAAITAGDRQAVPALLADLHAIKGGASFMELMTINLVTHRIETLIEQAVEQNVCDDPKLCRLIVAALESMTECVNSPDFGEERNLEPLLHDIEQHSKRITKRTARHNQLAEPPQATASPPTINAAPPTRQPFGTFLISTDKLPIDCVLDAILTQDKQQIHPITALRRIDIDAETCLDLVNRIQSHADEILPLARQLKVIDSEQEAACRRIIQASRPPLGQILIERGITDPITVRNWLMEFYSHRQEPQHETDQYAPNTVSTVASNQRQRTNLAIVKKGEDQDLEPSDMAPEAVLAFASADTDTAITAPSYRYEADPLHTLPKAGSISRNKQTVRRLRESMDVRCINLLTQKILTLERLPDGTDPDQPIDAVITQLDDWKAHAPPSGAVVLEALIQEMESLVDDLRGSPAALEPSLITRTTSALLSCLSLAWSLRNEILERGKESHFTIDNEETLIACLAELKACQTAITEGAAP